jgi:P27 family predicted phage terminase small subunit
MAFTKPKLIKYLKQKGIYDAVDDLLIEELFYNIEILEKSKKDIDERGIIVPINTSHSLFNTNPSVNIYNTAIKNIINLSRKIGISARDRKELGIDKVVEEDGF